MSRGRECPAKKLMHGFVPYLGNSCKILIALELVPFTPQKLLNRLPFSTFLPHFTQLIKFTPIIS